MDPGQDVVSRVMTVESTTIVNCQIDGVKSFYRQLSHTSYPPPRQAREQIILKKSSTESHLHSCHGHHGSPVLCH